MTEQQRQEWNSLTDFFDMIEFSIKENLQMECDHNWVYIQGPDGEEGGREVNLNLHDMHMKYLHMRLKL